MTDALTFDVVGSTAWLRLNRPQALNALNLRVLNQLGERLAEIAARDDLRVVVLTGTGAAFCVGADLKEALASTDWAQAMPDFIDCANLVFTALRNLPIPVIAALNGVTMAGGLELAMCADLIVAADTATIGDAHANFGVYPGGGGAAILPRLIPLNMALYLLFTGKSLSATDMKALGLVCEVHPGAELDDAVQRLADGLTKKSPSTLRRMKEVARASAEKSRTDALLHEQVMFREHLQTQDFQEGLRAFSERRTPHFTGH